MASLGGVLDCANAIAADRVNKLSASFCIGFSLRRLLFRPHDALILFRNRSKTFVDEFLHTLAAVGLGGVDLAFRIRSDAVHCVELTSLAPSATEPTQNFHPLPHPHMNLLLASLHS